MYLPPASGSTLLRLLQLPLWLYDFGSPHSAVLDEESAHSYRREKLHHLGNISPYHDAPSIPGVSEDLPDDCSVDQVILLHRHGSRGPVMEQENIIDLVAKLDEVRDSIQAANLPPELQFLKDGYEYQLVPEELSIIGRQELFNHGVEFNLRYPEFSTDLIMTTTVRRVIDSAFFFAQGLFGREAKEVTFTTPEDDSDDPITWLDPWRYCPNMPYDDIFEEERYLPPIQDRLNKLVEDVEGFEFSLDDVRGALYACPYDLAARNRSPWCNVFTEDELEGLDYSMDLALDTLSGRALGRDPGTLVGAVYIKKLISRLTDEAADPLYLDFAHDFSILFPLATMHLNKDPTPLRPTHPSADRKFKSSYQTPFAASMVWEKFTCKTSFEGPQVRLVLNDATFPLSFCQVSEADMNYGTCSLDSFVQENEYALSVEYQDDHWKAVCGIPEE